MRNGGHVTRHLSAEHFDGAITNARSLVEAVLTAIEAEFDSATSDYDGDLQRLYKRVAKQLNLSEESSQVVALATRAAKFGARCLRHNDPRADAV